MSKDTGGPAFPNHTLEPNPDGGQPRIIWQEGMTLRDYFAAQALPFCLKNCFSTDGATERAYAIADSMLKERGQ